MNSCLVPFCLKKRLDTMIQKICADTTDFNIKSCVQNYVFHFQLRYESEIAERVQKGRCILLHYDVADSNWPAFAGSHGLQMRTNAGIIRFVRRCLNEVGSFGAVLRQGKGDAPW